MKTEDGNQQHGHINQQCVTDDAVRQGRKPIEPHLIQRKLMHTDPHKPADGKRNHELP